MYRWELEDEAEQALASLPHVRPVLARFLDALVIVDPAEYRRDPDDPPGPLRHLSFGSHDEGLVSFLVYEPDELVLVLRVQWLG